MKRTEQIQYKWIKLNDTCFEYQLVYSSRHSVHIRLNLRSDGRAERKWKAVLVIATRHRNPDYGSFGIFLGKYKSLLNAKRYSLAKAAERLACFADTLEEYSIDFSDTVNFDTGKLFVVLCRGAHSIN